MTRVRDTDANWVYEGAAYRVPQQVFEQCDFKPCSEMVSCQEAQHYYDACGITELDDDGDGTPCENVCGG
ncbi:excalibur calcium-binding domain-containing protein [Patescibacteria group bacterium]|nr:excalibur calcium-binding domain-containing protein [Patescibacteria group bacterium]